MLDIGFAELLVIFVIGLLVLGPERLPGVVRNVSLWVGRLRRSFNALRDEIEREVGADEIKRQLHNEDIMSSLKETKEGLSRDYEQTREQLKSLEYDVSDVVKPRDDEDPEDKEKPPESRPKE